MLVEVSALEELTVYWMIKTLNIMKKYKMWSLLSVIPGATANPILVVTVTILDFRDYFKFLYPPPMSHIFFF